MVCALRCWLRGDITETTRSGKPIIFAIHILREKVLLTIPEVGELEANSELENTEKDWLWDRIYFSHFLNVG